jgi:hypothetical protein
MMRGETWMTSGEGSLSNGKRGGLGLGDGKGNKLLRGEGEEAGRVEF